MSALLKRMCGQSQHCIDPYFMGSNIARYHRFDFKLISLVRRFASYFYLRSMLDLLGLGPYRANLLLKCIKQKFSNAEYEQNFSELAQEYATQKNILTFLTKYFFSGINALASHDQLIKKLTDKQADDINHMLVTWALHITDEVKRVFGASFIEEKDDVGRYVDMQLPEAYHSKTFELTESDSIAGDEETDDTIDELVNVNDLASDHSTDLLTLDMCANEIVTFLNSKFKTRTLIPNQHLDNFNIIKHLQVVKAHMELIVMTTNTSDLLNSDNIKLHLKQFSEECEDSYRLFIFYIYRDNDLTLKVKTVERLPISEQNPFHQQKDITLQKPGDFADAMQTIDFFLPPDNTHATNTINPLLPINTSSHLSLLSNSNLIDTKTQPPNPDILMLDVTPLNNNTVVDAPSMPPNNTLATNTLLQSLPSSQPSNTGLFANPYILKQQNNPIKSKPPAQSQTSKSKSKKLSKNPVSEEEKITRFFPKSTQQSPTKLVSKK
jgi:hypothetical protein